MSHRAILAFQFTCCILSALLAGSSQAQSSKTTRPAPVLPQGSVQYRQQLAASLPPTATLVFNGSTSLYYGGRKDVAGTSTETTQQGEKQVITVQDREGQCVYIDRTRNQLVSRVAELSLSDNVLLEEPIPAFAWVLGSATKTVGAYRVQQASTSFRGRRYEVWFAPDIPLPLGPWKFGGLPGLILEAYDTEKKFVFEATAINIPTTLRTPVVPPTQGQRVVGWAAYQELVKASRTRLSKSMQARTPGLTLKLTPTGALEILE